MTEKETGGRTSRTPMCDSYFASLGDDEERDIAQADADELEREIAGRKPGTPRPDRTRPVYSVKRMLSSWESLARWLAGEFPNSSKLFFLEEYANRLERRDYLQTLTRELPERTSARLIEYLAVIDTKFRESTVDDDGSAFGTLSGKDPENWRNKAWWWHRRPEPIPWAGRYPGVPGEPTED